MEEPLKEPTVIEAPPGPVLLLLFGSWTGWGVVFFWVISEETLAIRLLGALVGGFVFALMSLAVVLVGYPKWQRPMTPGERAKWEKENAERAAKILTAREARERKQKEALARQEELRRARERKLRQVREGAAQLIAEMEADPMIASMLRTARRDTSKEAGEELLTSAEIALAGLGAWLTEQEVPNRLPGDLFAGFAKGKIKEHFSSLSSKERKALQKYLPRVAQVLEEALEVMNPRKVVKEILLPLFFGETTDQTQDE